MTLRSIFLAICLGLISVGSYAEEDKHAQIIAGLKKVVPGLPVDSIRPSPLNGVYEVLIGADILYVSEDGRYILSGDLYDVESQQNLSEIQKSNARKVALSNIPKEQFIEFAPEVTEHTIYVFTDISCGYCRKLHQDVPELNKNGISVKYLAYPRAGANSNAGYELSAVWCAKDRNKAMTDAKSGQAVSSEECDDPIESHHKIGGTLGVSGTPAIFLENGRAVPGYYPPDELLKLVKM